VKRAERELFARLAACGLVERQAPSLYRPCVRLFRLRDRFLATDLASHDGADQVFSLMLEQAYVVRNMDVRPADDVLELGLGSGVNALFAADVARSVTGVDVNPRALAFASFNEALNPAPRPLDCREGSLFEPLEPGRTFDVVLANPPFELVPREEPWYLHSDGGEDGLDVVRSILRDLPGRLAPKGRFQMITWSPGTPRGPLLLDLLVEALPGARLSVHALGAQPLDDHLRTFSSSPHYGPWREQLRARDLCDLHFLFVHAEPADEPGVEVVTPEAEIAACAAIADGWLA
jgi:hypothetical protein